MMNEKFCEVIVVSLHLCCLVINVDVIIIEHGVGVIVAPLLLRHHERRYIKRNTPKRSS